MANNINILGDLVSQDAVKRVEELANAVEKIATQSEKFISNLGGVSGGTGGNNTPTGSKPSNNSTFDADTKSMEKLIKVTNDLSLAQNKLNSEIQQNRVNSQYINQQRKLEAQAISQEATELQRLYAQQELANREAQKIASTIGMESKEFFEASKKAKDLTAEIIKLETATGKMAGKATNTNYALFSLTQVVRELPNFAMSARIGFMSLSNNLPQLVDGFTTLKNSVDETGEILGNIGALKEFASSLLSLNTVVIIATTLMVAYGDKVWEWIESMFKAVDVTDRYSLATKTLLKVFSDTSSEANKTTERMLHLGIAIDKYKSGTLTASEQTKQANWIVKEYNETLGIHDKKINNVSEAIIGYNNNAKKFIEYTIAMNASMLSMQESANQLQRARGAEVSMNAIIPDAKARQELNNFFDFARKGYINYYTSVSDLAHKQLTEAEASNIFAKDLEEKNLNFYYTDKNKKESYASEYNKLILKYGKEDLDEYLKQLTIKNVATNKSLKSRKDAEYFYRFDEYKNTTDSGSSNTVQTAKTKLIAEEFYDKQRIELVKQLAKLEEDISKERLDGTLNDYKVREEANEKYYSISQALAEKDKEVAIKNLDSKTAKELEELQKVDDENQKKFKARKITQEELTRANAVNADSEKNLIANHEAELLKIRDEYEKKTIENTKKFAQEDRKIMQDLYNDKAYIIQQELVSEKNKNAITAQKATNKLIPNSVSSIASGISGFNPDTSFQQMAIAQAEIEANNQAEIDAEKKKLDALDKLNKNYTQNKLELDRSIAEKEKAMAQQKEMYELKRIESIEKKKSELKVQLAQKAEQLIMQLIKNSFDAQLKALDKRHEKEKAITDERYQEVEDKEKKGVLTKQQAEDEKNRISAYARGQEREIEREKAEVQKKQFYVEQGISLAKIAMSTAQGVMQAVADFGVLSPPVIAMVVGLGAIEAGLVLSQKPPAFKDGGIMPYDGTALVGDGGKNEVLITPDGKIGITPNKDTYMNLEKGTKILPDVNKVNLDSLVAYMNVDKSYVSTKILENEIRGLRKDLNKKKQPILSNVPLLNTLEFSDKINRRSNTI